MGKREIFRWHNIPHWVTPLASIYYATIIIPYKGRLSKMRNVQKHDVINEILREYKDKAPKYVHFSWSKGNAWNR